jgi:hypothetical protein
MTIQVAARLALDVLTTIQLLDADQGITDPDIAEAVDALLVALKRAGSKAACPPGRRRDKPNRWGFQPGEPLRVVAGPRAGAAARFLGVASTTQIYVEIAGARRTIYTKLIERGAA